ncbi:TPA: hypothetical protein EYP66_25295 [Candidatus Poribacteria bacterium]|nr:hypothetical protein [Candidatus Poribacteria bacterium]
MAEINRKTKSSVNKVNIFDRTLKIIARDHAEVFLKLAFPDEKIDLVGTLENVELSLPAERVDFVHEIEYNSEEYLLHIKFQLQHKQDLPKRVFVYSAELTDQFDKPVISLALYLQRRESPIPENYTVSLGKDVINRFSYPVLKIWDYEKEIRSGELRELAPLSPMIVKEPTVEMLEEEQQLILQEKDDKKRARLFATAITIASRYFERDFLWKFFREEMEQMREVPFISDWLKEERQEGLLEGRQEGYAQACREDIISLLEDFDFCRSLIVYPISLGPSERYWKLSNRKNSNFI